MVSRRSLNRRRQKPPVNADVRAGDEAAGRIRREEHHCADQPYLAARCDCRLCIKDVLYSVALVFLENCLRNYQQARLGWALWNFDGPFGILDSERLDVDYEEWRGYELDRKMLCCKGTEEYRRALIRE